MESDIQNEAFFRGTHRTLADRETSVEISGLQAKVLRWVPSDENIQALIPPQAMITESTRRKRRRKFVHVFLPYWHHSHRQGLREDKESEPQKTLWKPLGLQRAPHPFQGPASLQVM